MAAWGTERTPRWIARNGQGPHSGEGHADAAWLAHDQSATERGRWSTGCANASAGRRFLREDNDVGVRLEGGYGQSTHGSNSQSLGCALNVRRKQWRRRSRGGVGPGNYCIWGRTEEAPSAFPRASVECLALSPPLAWSLYIHTHLALTLWHQGPLTRTVSDAALMLTVMAGPDIRDWYAGPELSIDYRNGLGDGVQELRIAYSRTLGYAKPDSRRCLFG